MKKALLTLQLLMPFLLPAQKTYSWCPKEIKSAPRENLPAASIDIKIFDGRTIEGKQKGEGEPDISVSITVLSYHSQFYPTVWIGRSKIMLKLKDNRTQKEYTEEFNEERKSGNALGMPNAKRALAKAFSATITDMLNYVTQKVS